MFTTWEKTASITTSIHEQIMEELRSIYPEVLNESDMNLPYALAQINDVTGDRFVVIIDEWDAIF